MGGFSSILVSGEISITILLHDFALCCTLMCKNKPTFVLSFAKHNSSFFQVIYCQKKKGSRVHQKSLYRISEEYHITLIGSLLF